MKRGRLTDESVQELNYTGAREERYQKGKGGGALYEIC